MYSERSHSCRAHHHPALRSHTIAVERQAGSFVRAVSWGSRYPNIEIKVYFLLRGRSLGRVVPRVDRRWNKHVVVGIPPPPSRCRIPPTHSPLHFLISLRIILIPLLRASPTLSNPLQVFISLTSTQYPPGSHPPHDR